MKKQESTVSTKLRRIEYALRIKREHKKGRVFLTQEGQRYIEKWIK